MEATYSPESGRRVLTTRRPSYDPKKSGRMRVRRSGVVEVKEPLGYGYSPLSPEALGVDLEGMDLDHPPTPPDDEIPGVTITGEMVKEWPKDHRDRWKTNEPSYRQFSTLCESHERHRHKPVPVQGTVLHLPYGFYLLNSVMGSGKNVVATFYAAIYYAFGWPAASTAATKFGKHLGPAEIYHFAIGSPLGMFYLVDEIHAIFHSNTTGANREVSFQDNTTSMRKRESTFMGMSASKRIAPSYRAIVDWIGYVHPLSFAPGRGGNGWKETWKYVNWYGPRPYDRDDFEEERGFRKSTSLTQWHETFNSDLLLEAMKLMDSWADVKTMFGDGYTAQDEREDRKILEGGGDTSQDGGSSGALAQDVRGIARAICNWLAGGYFQQYEEAFEQYENGEKGQRRKATITLNQLSAMFGEISKQEVPATAVRRSLEAHNVGVTQRGNIGIEEIVAMWFKYNQASGEDGTGDTRIGG